MRSCLMTAAAILATVPLSVQSQPAPADPSPEAQQQQQRNATPDTRGTGPFAALKEIDPGLPDHVVYRPADLAALAQSKLGIYVFGNGGCTDDGASSRLHLLEVASHGYLAIAPGGIYNGPGRTDQPPRPSGGSIIDTAPTQARQLRDAIDWALAENERAGSRYYGRLEPAAIAISGYSCGGVQALAVAHDSRARTAIIMNSGLFVDGPTEMAGMKATKDLLLDLHFPTLYILGGPTDIAYENGMDDFARIEHVPVAVANIDKGHGGTYWEANGGPAAQVAVDWLDWRLRGDAQAGKRFLGEDCGLCVDPVWTFDSKGFGALEAAK